MTKVIPIKYYDNTMLGDYKKCPRYFYFRHVRGWTPSGIAMPLIFGLAWHAAMDVIWRGYKKMNKDELVSVAMAAFEDVWIEEGCKPIKELGLQDLEMLGARTPYTAQEMLHGYLNKRSYILESSRLIAAESPFAVPIYPDRDDIFYIGRRDKKIETDTGDLVILEHKTTSEYKVEGGFKEQYIQSWWPNSQCEGYLYAGRMEDGDKVRSVWVDAALVHKKVHDAFRFIPISATFSTLDNWLWEARDWINRVESEKQRLAGQPADRTVMGAFPRNTDQCSGKYGLCTYQSLCRSYHNPEQVTEAPAGFQEKFWEPFDTLKIEELGGIHGKNAPES